MTWFYIFNNVSGHLISETSRERDIVDPIPGEFTVLQRADRFDGFTERWNKTSMGFETYTDESHLNDLLRERDAVKQQITDAGGDPDAPAP